MGKGGVRSGRGVEGEVTSRGRGWGREGKGAEREGRGRGGE